MLRSVRAALPPVARPVVAQGALGLVAIAVIGLGASWAASLVREVLSANSVDGHHDFFAFYSAASLIADHRPESLYDRDAVMAVQRGFFSQPVGWAGYMAYLNPPFAAAMQLPLASFPEETARLLWLAVSLVLAAACAVLATGGVRGATRWLVALVLLATFPVFQALVEGQWSFVLLLGCLGALLAARRDRRFVAGLCLGALAIKPPLLLLALAWLLLARQWRAMAGTVTTVVAAVVAALPLTGLSPYPTYVRYMLDVGVSHANGAGTNGASAWSGSIRNMEGLNGLAVSLVGQQNALLANVLTLLPALLVLAIVVAARPWRGSITAADGLAAVAAGLLLYPNLYGQDCVLALVLFAIAAPSIREPKLQVAAALGLAVVLDLAVLDTMAAQDTLLGAPHIPTLALLAGLIGYALRARLRNVLVLPWLVRGRGREPAGSIEPALEREPGRREQLP